jgi:hypothetical protein
VGRVWPGGFEAERDVELDLVLEEVRPCGFVELDREDQVRVVRCVAVGEGWWDEAGRGRFLNVAVEGYTAQMDWPDIDGAPCDGTSRTTVLR